MLWPIFGALLLILPGVAFAADEDLRALVKALSQQVQQLSHRVADLEGQLAKEKQSKPQPGQAPSKATDSKPPPATAEVAATAKQEPQAVTVGDIKGSIKIPGTDTSLAIGGYAKLDAIYSSASAGRDNFGDQFLVISSIPVGIGRLGENSQTTIHAKESRFWFKSFTPSAYGDINTYLELDLYGAPDTYTPHLRHAYGSIGNFLAGQTWSTFLNVAAIPDTLDIGGPAGIGLVRQPMIRWTQPFALSGFPLEFQAALESPKSRLDFANSPLIVAPDDDRYPDLIARLNAKPAWGELSLTAMGRQIRYAPIAGNALSSWGGALSLAGKLKTAGLDNIRFSLSYGNVLGRYIILNTFADAAIDNQERRLALADTYSGLLSYQHWWNERWRSTVAYSFAQTQLPGFASGLLTRQGQSLHVNLLWSPVVQTTFGLEYIYANRTLENGLFGDLHRVQFSSRFNF